MPVFRGGGGSGGGAGATGSWGAPMAKPPKAKPRATLTVKPALKLDHNQDTDAPKQQSEVRYVSKNGYGYEIDLIGRTRRVSGTITLNPKQKISKTNQLQAGGPDRLPGSDQGGHYIARQFNGPTEAFNHFAQDANFNKSRYAKLEFQWKKMTRRGKRVFVDIRPLFKGDSQRPYGIIVRYRIGTKKPQNRFIPNQAGGKRK